MIDIDSPVPREAVPAFETEQRQRHADVIVEEALEVLRPSLTLRGNIDQITFMCQATPREVEEKVRDLLTLVKPRGNWILSTTDFFFDGTPYENIHAFAEAGRKYGQY